MHLWTKSKVYFPKNSPCHCLLRTQVEDTTTALLPELILHRLKQQGEGKEGKDLWAGKVRVGQHLFLRWHFL